MKLFLLNVIFLLTIFLSHSISAQSPFGVSKEKFNRNIYHIELSGGVMYPSMKYSNTLYDNSIKSKVIDKTGGLALRIQFKENISFSTQVAYRSGSISMPDQNNYILNTHYLNLYTPFEFNWKFSKKKKKGGNYFILYAGPYIATNFGGKMSSSNISLELTDNEIAPYDYGFETGLGIRIPVYSLSTKSNFTIKASYVHGLANTFPRTFEKYSNNELNEYLLSTTGDRFIRGFQFTLTYEINLEKKAITNFTAGGDGKKTYKKFLVH